MGVNIKNEKTLIVLLGLSLITNNYLNVNALSIDRKIGVNGNVDIPIENLREAYILREYHNF